VAFRLVMKDQQVGRQFSTRMAERGREFKQAIVQVARETKDEMVREGRDEIRRSGNFGSSRWIDGFNGEVTVQGDDISIVMTHDVPYWTTHQFGATIHGRPLLWIPLSFAQDAQGVRARDFPGQLVRVDRKSGGAPLLIEVPSGDPKYSGHASVKIPKRWNLVEEIREIAKQIPERFRAAVRSI
jgi:hypothetical protein